MKPRLTSLTLSASLACLIVGLGAPRAFAETAVSVYSESTLAPNAFGSPSYDAWSQNAITALETDTTTVGAAGPTQFTVNNSPKPIADNIATGFASWDGNANPAAAYGAAYANELGNRASSDVIVKGNGSLIQLADLGFLSVSSDPGNNLGFQFGPGGSGWSGPFDVYDSSDIGLILNPDGSIKSVIDSGPATQLVNEIISVGAGDAYAVDSGGQADINAAVAGIAPYDYTTTWTYGNASTSDTQVFVASVPDTGGVWMMYGTAAAGMILFKKESFKKGGAPVPAI